MRHRTSCTWCRLRLLRDRRHLSSSDDHDTSLVQEVQPSMVSVFPCEVNQHDPRVDDQLGTREAGLNCGVELGALDPHPMSCSVRDGVGLGMHRDEAWLQRSTPTVVEQLAIAVMVAVRKTSWGSVVTTAEDATISGDDCTYVVTTAGGSLAHQLSVLPQLLLTTWPHSASPSSACRPRRCGGWPGVR